ncbi:MAG: hypothetical protein CMN72_03825 [Sphingomonas sp.]|nr:hypothetical protein [Sphingomonas sp.]
MADPAARPSLSALARLLLMLSVTTGMIDAVSVLGLGQVFTANMTGNIVFMGFALAGAKGFHVISYIVALASFLCGATIAGRIGAAHRERPLKHWLMRSAVIEVALLWIAAGIALGFDIAAQSPSWRLYAVLTLTGVSMGYRNGTVRQLKVPDLTTTVLTLTLTGLAADSRLASGSNPNFARRITAVAAILIGAVIGAMLVLNTGLALPLALTGATILIATMITVVFPGRSD